jgi:nucleoside-diphosphate-sugar epimerase
VLYVSTGHVYAAQPAPVRIAEDMPLAPRSTYARTKLLGEQELERLARARAVPLVIARVFGLIAPRQPGHYVLPGLIARARTGDLAAIPGLSSVRDYLDARDVCRVLIALCRRAPPAPIAVCNVCSGEGVTIRRLLETVCTALGRPVPTELGEAPGRPDDVPWIVGDPGRLAGWLGVAARPEIPLARTVADALAG